MISSIRVVGGASPEGSVRINNSLSKHRADRIFDFFASRTMLKDSVTTFDFIGRDWAGLARMVAEDPEVPGQREVLTLIKEIQDEIKKNGKDSEKNLLRLKTLGGGRPYAYMYKNIFPALRTSALYIEYSYRYPERVMLSSLPPEELEVNVEIPETPQFEIPDDLIAEGDICRPFYMGLKTNMLYDALALPSVGAEFYIGRQWSVTANWTYGWWDKDSRHRYWRAYGGDIALRRWFGKAASEKPLTGHHLGIYGGVVTYDFEFGGKGYMGGLPGKTLWDRCNFMAGIEYGYSLPVARRLNIDFTIGVGYLWGKMIEYEPYENEYVWQKTKRVSFIGPTKAEISLVWLIGCDNYNRKKGGMDER
ncbi:MAG: DUF3575 domain-containing protein [Muribaculaceae bacterium]|nr:DUF3575 domain-containing protein [Muribaculaceae bacterium]